MDKFVKIAAKEGEAVADLLLDDDNSLSISTLHKYFPNAEGLKYYSDSDAVYHVICDEEKFYAPHRGWSDTIYYCTYGNVKEETISIEDIPIQGEEEEEEKEKEVKIVYISTNDRTKNIKKKKIKPKGKNKKRKPYKCDVCEKNFRNKDYMEKHKLVHTGEKPFSCSICEERFHRPDMVRLHVHKVHNIRREPKLKLPPRSPTAKREKRRNDTTYEWGVVKKRKYTRKKTELNQMNLEEVYLENSSDNPHNKYECGSCEMLFSDEVLFQEHSCSPQTQFTCEECSETFSKLNKLRLHFYKHHGPDQKKIVSRKFSKIRPQKYLNVSKQKTKSKYATNELEYVESDNDTSGDECSYWDCLNENEIRKSYVSKCDCVPNFSMLKYIENKIPSEVLAKFRRCKQNHIAWTGFLGYSALYKFWVRIVTDNPPEMNEINVNDEEKDDCLKDADYFVVEEEEPSEATTENTNFLKSLDDLIKFN